MPKDTKVVSQAQNRSPNFRSDGKLYLVRCFICDPLFGKENWMPAVASGKCAWCGWSEGDMRDK